MITRSIRSLTVCFTIVLAGCTYAPWYKAGYVPEHATFEYGRHCDPAVRAELAHLYVNDHFIHVNLFGSNRTTRSEAPPYRLVVTARSFALGEGYMRVHAVRLSTPGGKTYPVESMHDARNPSSSTYMPFTSPLREGKMVVACADRAPTGLQTVSEANASTQNVFELTPEDGASIDVEVDVEVSRGGTTQRSTIRHRLHPEVRKGRFIPLTA